MTGFSHYRQNGKTRLLRAVLESEFERDTNPSSGIAETSTVSRSCCTPHAREFCDDGYPLWVLWQRAELLAYSRRDYTGYESARSAWEAHKREGRRP